MNDDKKKLQTILTNMVDKCDGITFYKLYVNGITATIYKKNGILTVEPECGGESFTVNDIENVYFYSDYYYAEIDVNGTTYGIDIVKDLSPEEIEKMLG